MKNLGLKSKVSAKKIGKLRVIKSKVVFVGVGLLIIAIGILIIVRFSTP